MSTFETLTYPLVLTVNSITRALKIFKSRQQHNNNCNVGVVDATEDGKELKDEDDEWTGGEQLVSVSR